MNNYTLTDVEVQSIITLIMFHDTTSLDRNLPELDVDKLLNKLNNPQE